MSRHSDTTIPLEPNTFYHIFNRGNKGIKIFYQDRNYPYFLQKYDSILSPYLNTYSYNLIPNHFHLIVKIKSVEDILSSAKNDYTYLSKPLWKLMKTKLENFPIGIFKDFPDFLLLLNQAYPKDRYPFIRFLKLVPPFLKSSIARWLLSDCLKRFFSGYARAINVQEKENGSLFQKNFRRKIIDSETYFTSLIWYIHNNGAHHGLCSDFKDYPWSSYHRVLIERPSKLKKKEVLDWFGGRKEYIDFHKSAKVNWNLLNNVITEEDGLLSF